MQVRRVPVLVVVNCVIRRLARDANRRRLPTWLAPLPRVDVKVARRPGSPRAVHPIRDGCGKVRHHMQLQLGLCDCMLVALILGPAFLRNHDTRVLGGWLELLAAVATGRPCKRNHCADYHHAHACPEQLASLHAGARVQTVAWPFLSETFVLVITARVQQALLHRRLLRLGPAHHAPSKGGRDDGGTASA